MYNLYFAVAVLVFTAVNGRPNGAPELACSLLQPNHGNSKPQSATSFPYIVSMSKDTYSSPNDKITVTLKSPEGKPAFKGFLIAARDGAGKPLGSWTSSLGHALSCSAITHNDNSGKRSATFTWQPPKNATSGKVVMTAAVVQKLNTFWAHIPVKVQGSINESNATDKKTTTKGTQTSNVGTTVTIKPFKSTTISSKTKNS